MNKINVFRVDSPLHRLHIPEVGIGPYLFFRNVATSEKHKKWSAHCSKHEPAAHTYAQLKINPFALHRVPTLPRERRPGPFEDIGLREQMIKRVGTTKMGKDYFYCFDSIKQFKQWFHDPEELKFLADNYFTLSHYVVKASEFICGQRQAIFFKEGFLYLKTRYNILTLDSILPIVTPKPKVPYAKVS